MRSHWSDGHLYSEAGLGKKEILIKLKRIRQNINNNL